MNTQTQLRLSTLRKWMDRNNIHAFITPSTDPHSGEYVPERWKSREFISGFTGSAGTAVVTIDKAALWTDNRYFLQAAEQIKGTEFELMKIGLEGTPSIQEWLGDNCPPLFLVIPNIAIAEMASMTFIVPCGAVSQHHTETVKAIFDEMGNTLITDEQHLAAGTTLASCGIAYAMRYIRAAAEGGVELGFKADDAKNIVMQTMKGAVELLEASGLHPEAAIDLVTTPSGVTIKGLNEMEHAGFTSAVIRGLKAGLK